MTATRKPKPLKVAGTALLIALTGCVGQPQTASSGTPSGQADRADSATPTPRGRHRVAPKPAPQANPPATEFNPPGDIPDNQVFVGYRAPHSRVRIMVPEGWARKTTGGVTTFTDNYNSIAIQVVAQPRPPTVKSALHTEVPRLRRKVDQFAHGQVVTVQRQHGRAVLVTYFLDSAPNNVTGKVVRDSAQRYEFWHRGQEAVLTLTGPKGADNVDPWRIVSDSLHWQ
jgi:hypothetical protein